MNVFTYGSLMFDQVWSKVVNGNYERLKATLYGYERRKLKERTYPAVIPGNPSDSVDGILYVNVLPSDLLRLDRFEGDYYRKETADCLIGGGEVAAALVYVIEDRFSGLIEDKPWDPAWFAETGIRSFLDGYEGFSREAAR